MPQDSLEGSDAEETGESGRAETDVEDVHQWARRMRRKTLQISLAVCLSVPLLGLLQWIWNGAPPPRADPTAPAYMRDPTVPISFCVMFFVMVLTVGWIIGEIVIGLSPRWRVQDKDGHGR